MRATLLGVLPPKCPTTSPRSGCRRPHGKTVAVEVRFSATPDRAEPVVPDTRPKYGEPMKTACVIGAGAAGLAAGKALKDRNIDFDWFEKGSYVGGCGRSTMTTGRRGVSLVASELQSPAHPVPEFPDAEDWADYPPYYQVAQYFEDFADHFGLRDLITFNTAVEKVEPVDGHWRVTTSDGATHTYANVLVANGHHSSPKTRTSTVSSPARRSTPTITATCPCSPGSGCWSSGSATRYGHRCDAARNAEAVYLSTRHGVHVIPKYALGKPRRSAQFAVDGLHPVPGRAAGLHEAIVRVATGRPAGPRVAQSRTTNCSAPTPPCRLNSTTASATATSP